MCFVGLGAFPLRRVRGENVQDAIDEKHHMGGKHVLLLLGDAISPRIRRHAKDAL